MIRVANEWNSLAEPAKTPQGLGLAPEGLGTEGSSQDFNLWLTCWPTSACYPIDVLIFIAVTKIIAEPSII